MDDIQERKLKLDLDNLKHRMTDVEGKANMSGMSNERIAYLEAKQDSHHNAMQEIKETLHSLDSKVGKIEMKMEKSMSFFGGIAFTFSLLGGLAAFCLTFLLKKVGVLP
jgi:CII-binding regulator of phage lambda lysogenization HflD